MPDELYKWRVLRRELREVREKKGISRDDVTVTLGWPLSKLLKVEQGVTRPPQKDIDELIKFYTE